jgi:hypothetical protein
MNELVYCPTCKENIPCGKVLLSDSGRKLECPVCHTDLTPPELKADRYPSFTQEGKDLLKKYLDFMEGFSESTVYDDYQKYQKDIGKPITDQEYADAVELIRRLSK